MALTYTGRADQLIVDGRTYKPGDRVNISKQRAAALAASSRLHSFEDVDGDILEAATSSTPPPTTPDRAKAADRS